MHIYVHVRTSNIVMICYMYTIHLPSLFVVFIIILFKKYKFLPQVKLLIQNNIITTSTVTKYIFVRTDLKPLDSYITLILSSTGYSKG